MEALLLNAAIQGRSSFDELVDLEVEQNLTDKGKLVFKEIKKFYTNDTSCSFVDKEILKSRLTRLHPAHSEILTSFISEEDVSTTNLIKEVIAIKLEGLSHKMGTHLIAGKFDKFEPLLEDYNKLRLGEVEAEDTTEVAVEKSLEAVLETHDSKNKIKVLPLELNRALKGGVLRQHHIVVFAMSEMGKSLYVINMAYGFMRQDLRVLYCANEDPMDAYLMRFMNRITGMVEEEIRANPTKANELLNSRGYKNLIFAEMAPGSEREIDKLCEEYKPDVLIVDQIRNLEMGAVGRTIQLEMAASMMRKLGKKYNMISVSITQAGDSATGKKFLGRGDIDFSNVGIPATADLLIGIGADTEMESNGDRILSLVKNKITGVHEPIYCFFDNKLSKVI